jgi:hypothetical protein
MTLANAVSPDWRFRQKALSEADTGHQRRHAHLRASVANYSNFSGSSGFSSIRSSYERAVRQQIRPWLGGAAGRTGGSYDSTRGLGAVSAHVAAATILAVRYFQEKP